MFAQPVFARAVVACAVGLGAATAADAAMMLQIDLNSIAASSSEGTFDGETHTGSILFSEDGDSELAGIAIDGASQSVTADLMSLDGEIQLLNGEVTGGFIDVVLNDGSTYSTILGDVGSVKEQFGQGFLVDGMLDDGGFSNLPPVNLFGGVDVTEWVAAGENPGSFLLFGFGPDVQGFDGDADLELYVLVPSPGAATLAGLGLLAAVRRKR